MGTSLVNLLADGRMDDAIELQRRLVAVDPLSATKRANLGQLLMLADRFTDAQAEFERALELSPGGTYLKESIADVLIAQGRFDEALEVVSSIPPGHARDQRLAIVLFAKGDPAQSDAVLARVITLAELPTSDAFIPLTVAEVYAMRGETERAFEWLDKARLRSYGETAETMPGWLLFENLQVTSYLKPLHADPRWRQLLAELRSSPRAKGYESKYDH